MSNTVYEPLWYWVRERESIRKRREAGDPLPWTTDYILREWKFCNVRREDDRVTRWIHKNIRLPFAEYRYLWWMLCAARQINWPDTLAALVRSSWPDKRDFDLVGFQQVLDYRVSVGEQVFTGAYIITAPQEKGRSKTSYVTQVTLGNLWKDRDLITNQILQGDNTLQSVHKILLDYEGWGNFLAYQAVVDMRFCPSLLGDAEDIESWAAAGPGTIRGLNRIHGRSVNTRLSQKQALDEMRDIYDLIEDETGVSVDFSDVPNVLCETDKYLRVKCGDGYPRSRFHPSSRSAGLFGDKR